MIIFLMAKNLKNLALSKVLDIKKIEAVNQPIEKLMGFQISAIQAEEYLIH